MDEVFEEMCTLHAVIMLCFWRWVTCLMIQPQAPDYSRPFQLSLLKTKNKALVEMWDLGRYNTLRDELIKGRDFIVMPSEWWPNVPCPRRHGWLVQAVDSVILTRCKGCSDMVQLTFMDSASKLCHSCRPRTDSRNTGSAPKPRTPIRSCPHGSKRGRTKTVSPRSEKEPYSALRPLNEALPGELDLEEKGAGNGLHRICPSQPTHDQSGLFSF
jgi:hypothetical protein